MSIFACGPACVFLCSTKQFNALWTKALDRFPGERAGFDEFEGFLRQHIGALFPDGIGQGVTPLRTHLSCCRRSLTTMLAQHNLERLLASLAETHRDEHGRVDLYLLMVATSTLVGEIAGVEDRIVSLYRMHSDDGGAISEERVIKVIGA